MPKKSISPLTFITTSSYQTQKAGEILAKEILKTKLGKKAIVVGLSGELGWGKTTFLQGFAKGLEIREKILSPTFIIMKKFSIFNFQFSNFYHIDCYRIQRPKELLDLGFKEIISNPGNVVAVEWADKIKKILPQNTVWLKFDFINNQTREITLE